MKRVYISVGSNVNAESHIRSAMKMLKEAYGDLDVSITYQNPAVGFEGDDFLNLVVGFDSDKTPLVLAQEMREIEASLGRDRSQPKFSARTIDLDLLIIDNGCFNQDGLVLPRDEILKYAFVLKPLSELVGELTHPELKRSYQDIWNDFDQASQPMQALDISWE